LIFLVYCSLNIRMVFACLFILSSIDSYEPVSSQSCKVHRSMVNMFAYKKPRTIFLNSCRAEKVGKDHKWVGPWSKAGGLSFLVWHNTFGRYQIQTVRFVRPAQILKIPAAQFARIACRHWNFEAKLNLYRYFWAHFVLFGTHCRCKSRSQTRFLSSRTSRIQNLRSQRWPAQHCLSTPKLTQHYTKL
jgi:hypothetical protein